MIRFYCGICRSSFESDGLPTCPTCFMDSVALQDLSGNGNHLTPASVEGCTAWYVVENGKLVDKLLEQTGQPSNMVLVGFPDEPTVVEQR